MAARCGGGGGGEHLGAARGRLIRVPVDAISVDRLNVEKADRSFPRITELEGEDRGIGLRGPTSEGLPLPVESCNFKASTHETARKNFHSRKTEVRMPMK